MNSDKDVSFTIPIVIGILVILLWIGSGFVLYGDPDRGTFGDMFGAVNSLFSGLAFVGVITAILLQKRELSLQRKELELTRNELSGQKYEMALQNKTLLKQSFENTFFQLLSLQQEIVNSIDLIDTKNQNRLTTGRDCFKIFYTRLIKIWASGLSQLAGSNEIERINLTYINFYQKHQSEIGHYFRSLYHIVKLVDQSNVEDKRLYTNLVRAQLSSYELTLLFYNCLSEMGRDKFKPLIEKYALLKNLPKNQLIDQAGHENHYDPSAFA